MDMDEKLLNKQIKGLLIGTAVGDAIGLPREGLSANRAKKLFGSKLQHSLIVTPWGRIGLCSDDTEHAVMVGQCLLELNENRDNFLKLLARHMRCWFLTLPFGIGMATLKACFKLCLGINPNKTGVKSAGNGAVMRAPIIGLFFADNMQMMKKTLQESTYITHSDSRAFEGAWTIAMAARYAANHTLLTVFNDKGVNSWMISFLNSFMYNRVASVNFSLGLMISFSLFNLTVKPDFNNGEVLNMIKMPPRHRPTIDYFDLSCFPVLLL